MSKNKTPKVSEAEERSTTHQQKIMPRSHDRHVINFTKKIPYEYDRAVFP